MHKYQFPRFFPYDGFCCILSYCEKFTGKPMHFLYGRVYHGMGRKHPYYGKTLGTNYPDFPIRCVLLPYFNVMRY